MEISILIIKDLGNQKYILKCALCKGTGKWTDIHDDGICPICSGKGLVLVNIDGSLPFVKCAYCNGEGEIMNSRCYYNKCKACGGVGAQPITGSMKIIR